jgi:hypothetical protein
MHLHFLYSLLPYFQMYDFANPPPHHRRIPLLAEGCDRKQLRCKISVKVGGKPERPGHRVCGGGGGGLHPTWGGWGGVGGWGGGEGYQSCLLHTRRKWGQQNQVGKGCGELSWGKGGSVMRCCKDTLVFSRWAPATRVRRRACHRSMDSDGRAWLSRDPRGSGDHIVCMHVHASKRCTLPGGCATTLACIAVHRRTKRVCRVKGKGESAEAHLAVRGHWGCRRRPAEALWGALGVRVSMLPLCDTQVGRYSPWQQQNAATGGTTERIGWMG